VPKQKRGEYKRGRDGYNEDRQPTRQERITMSDKIPVDPTDEVALDVPLVGLELKTKDGTPHTFHMTTRKARALGLRLIKWADELDAEQAAKDN